MHDSTIFEKDQQENTIFGVWRDLTPADLIVYQALNHLGEYCLQDEIAQLTGLSNRQIVRSIGALAAANLIRVNKAGNRNYYRLQRDNKVTHGVTKIDSTNTTLNNHGETVEEPIAADQLTLIEHKHQQDLGALDIAPQIIAPQMVALDRLGIKPDLRQTFPTAPDKCQRLTPAQILMFDPEAYAISENLARWREAAEAGRLAGLGLRPALIWVKIVELQAPPAAALEPALTIAPAVVEAADASQAAAPAALDPDLSAALALVQAQPHTQEVLAPRLPGYPATPPPDPDLAPAWDQILANIKLTQPHLYNAHFAGSFITANQENTLLITVKPQSCGILNHQWRKKAAKTLNLILNNAPDTLQVQFIPDTQPPLPDQSSGVGTASAKKEIPIE